MALTAEALYQSSQLEPEDLGEHIIDPTDAASDQLEAAINWVDDNVLPIADAEVSVPLLKVTGYDSVTGFINGRFPGVAPATRSGWIGKGDALYDGAVLSYGRSEINKSINSNDESYDRDSDQDRIQGNQRLQKLLEWAEALIATGAPGDDARAPVPSRAGSFSVPTIPVW